MPVFLGEVDVSQRTLIGRRQGAWERFQQESSWNLTTGLALTPFLTLISCALLRRNECLAPGSEAQSLFSRFGSLSSQSLKGRQKLRGGL